MFYRAKILAVSFVLTMHRRGMTETTMLTEFEESVSFDADDPDFAPTSNAVRNVLLRDVHRLADIKFDVNKGRHTLTLLIASPLPT